MTRTIVLDTSCSVPALGKISYAWSRDAETEANVKDTPETIRQIRLHNAAIAALCKEG